MMEQSQPTSYEKEFMPFCIKYGQMINLLMIPTMFLPVLGLMLFLDAKVNITAAISGCVAYIAYEFPYYFSEPIALGPILGVPGTYMGYAAGNTANVCAVATSAALEASGAQSGTPKGTVMSTLAVSVAVATKAVLVFLLSLIGGWVLRVVPHQVIDCLTYLLPAIYGVLFVQFSSADFRMGGILFTIATVLYFLLDLGVLKIIPFYGDWTNTLLMVVIGVLLGRFMYRRDSHKATSSGQAK